MIGMSIFISFMGLMIASFLGLIPIDVPPALRFMFFMFGVLLFVTGFFMLVIRLKKTGANYLIEPGNPDKIIWFYIRKDGTVRITPSFRKAEAMLYNPEMDAHVPDIRGYQLADHQVRFVLEELGKVVDVDYCMYANVLKSKYGFENLQDIYNKIFHRRLSNELKGNREIPLSEIHKQPVPIPPPPSKFKVRKHFKRSVK